MASIRTCRAKASIATCGCGRANSRRPANRRRRSDRRRASGRSAGRRGAGSAARGPAADCSNRRQAYWPPAPRCHDRSRPRPPTGRTAPREAESLPWLTWGQGRNDAAKPGHGASRASLAPVGSFRITPDGPPKRPMWPPCRSNRRLPAYPVGRRARGPRHNFFQARDIQTVNPAGWEFKVLPAGCGPTAGNRPTTASSARRSRAARATGCASPPDRRPGRTTGRAGRRRPARCSSAR